MMMSDSFLSDASWLFFAAWSVVLAIVGVAAFGRDLLPSRATVDSVNKVHSREPIQPGNPAVR